MINDCVTPLAHHRPLPSLQTLPPASLRPGHKDLKHKQKRVIRIVKKDETENSTQPLTASLRPDHKDLKHKHTDMKFVKNFTPSDFQAKNFTPSISPNFNSFSDKNTKK